MEVKATDAEVGRVSAKVKYRGNYYTDSDLKALMGETMRKIYRNAIYQVVERVVEREDYPAPLVHLSIKRVDRREIRDWGHFQRIKNELVGEEYEAVELYPREARRVEGNQYHLWCFLSREFRWPFGFDERWVPGELRREGIPRKGGAA